MTLGIAVSTFPTSFGPIMVSGDLERKVEKIAQVGYDSLDLFIKSADEPGLPEVVKRIRETGLTVSIVAAVSAFVDEGLYLSDLDNNSRREMIRRMKDQIEFAASLDADVPIGVLRGSKGGSKYLRTLAESMIELYEFAEPLGVDLLLEPVNRYETEMINTVVEAFEFIERYDLPPFNLLPDLFHMNIEEADICAALKLAAGRIGHLHLADSNRRVPGMGHQPWDDIAETLAAIGYRGSYAFETIPGAEPFVDAQVGIYFIRNLFDKYSLVP